MPLRDSRRRRTRVLWTLASILAIPLFGQAGAENRQPIDTQQSTITVRVGRSGMFKSLGDDHEIRGSVKQGFIDDGAQAVEILVDAQRLRVLDPHLSPKDRGEVQARMLGAEVLDANRFPEIRFISSMAEKTSSGWIVRGQLTLHGQTRPVSANVTMERDHYKGSARVRQTDFGITPVTVAGGAVKVKDELTIEFDILTRLARTTER